MIEKTTMTAFILGLFFFSSGCGGTRPAHLGVKHGKLAPCPASPNCVSSRASDDAHRIAPIPYSGTLRETMAKLKAAIQSMNRAQIVTVTDRYLHVEFTSALFRFVDDVEFYFDADRNVIEVRSASRVGYSDLGVNRKRIETIRTKLNQSL